MSIRVKIFEENMMAGHGHCPTTEEIINTWLESTELIEQVHIRIKDFKYFPALNGDPRLICIYEV